MAGLFTNKTIGANSIGFPKNRLNGLLNTKDPNANVYKSHLSFRNSTSGNNNEDALERQLMAKRSVTAVATSVQSLMKFDSKKDINTQFKFLSTIGKGAYGSVILV